MKRTNIFSVVLGLLVTVGIMLSSAFLFPNSFTFRPFGVNEVSQLLTLLALVALFLERAMEVFINTWRRPREEELDNEIQNNQRVIEDKTKLREVKIEQPQKAMLETTSAAVGRDSARRVTRAVTVEATTDGTDTLTTELDAELEKLKKNEQLRSAYKSQTRKIALWTALFVGLVISGVGIRSLDTLVQPVQGTLYTGMQSVVFRCLDVLLTGGLIAGGSDGIHKITQLFSTYFEETRNGLKEKAAS